MQSSCAILYVASVTWNGNTTVDSENIYKGMATAGTGSTRSSVPVVTTDEIRPLRTFRKNLFLDFL